MPMERVVDLSGRLNPDQPLDGPAEVATFAAAEQDFRAIVFSNGRSANLRAPRIALGSSCRSQSLEPT